MPILLNQSYAHLLKPVLFKLDPEFVHDQFTHSGAFLGKHQISRQLVRRLLNFDHPSLVQNLNGLTFRNPIGLSAGFDYNALLPSILPSVGFGFGSSGTITFKPYDGNAKPRLTRLPLTQSILVNKGFKSAGIKMVMNNYLQKPQSDYNLGLSIGATNSPETSEPQSQIKDILASFEFILAHPKYKLVDYLELNISCPNVMGAGTLASPKHLNSILRQIQTLNLQKPLWIKFPIHVEDDEALTLVDIMIKHQVSAVVIGNLYKKRDPHTINPQELAQVSELKGNFSGKPTQNLSNHLIAHTYKHFGKDITIIGVGGIFSAKDAYEKIKLGASLVQLITGMIYEGPGLIGDINRDLTNLIRRDGFDTIYKAVGTFHRK